MGLNYSDLYTEKYLIRKPNEMAVDSLSGSYNMTLVRWIPLKFVYLTVLTSPVTKPSSREVTSLTYRSPKVHFGKLRIQTSGHGG